MKLKLIILLENVVACEYVGLKKLHFASLGVSFLYYLTPMEDQVFWLVAGFLFGFFFKATNNFRLLV